MRGRLLVLGLGLLAWSACGGGHAGAVDAGDRGLGGSGTLEGEGAFPVEAAYFHVVEYPADTDHRFGTSDVLSVDLLPVPLTCEAWSLGGAPDAGTVGIVVSQGSEFTPGTYPFHYPGQMYSVDYGDVSTAGRSLAGGELKLDVITQDRAAGSFDAFDTLQDGGTVRLSGTFDAVRCEATSPQ